MEALLCHGPLFPSGFAQADKSPPASDTVHSPFRLVHIEVEQDTSTCLILKRADRTVELAYLVLMHIPSLSGSQAGRGSLLRRLSPRRIWPISGGAGAARGQQSLSDLSPRERPAQDRAWRHSKRLAHTLWDLGVEWVRREQKSTLGACPVCKQVANIRDMTGTSSGITGWHQTTWSRALACTGQYQIPPDHTWQHHRPRTSKPGIAYKRDGGFDSRPPPLPGVLARRVRYPEGPSPLHRTEKRVQVPWTSGPEDPRAPALPLRQRCSSAVRVHSYTPTAREERVDGVSLGSIPIVWALSSVGTVSKSSKRSESTTHRTPGSPIAT